MGLKYRLARLLRHIYMLKLIKIHCLLRVLLPALRALPRELVVLAERLRPGLQQNSRPVSCEHSAGVYGLVYYGPPQQLVEQKTLLCERLGAQEVLLIGSPELNLYRILLV
jgi:hypothetical protein